MCLFRCSSQEPGQQTYATNDEIETVIKDWLRTKSSRSGATAGPNTVLVYSLHDDSIHNDNEPQDIQDIQSFSPWICRMDTFLSDRLLQCMLWSIFINIFHSQLLRLFVCLFVPSSTSTSIWVVGPHWMPISAYFVSIISLSDFDCQGVCLQGI
jgi:hypothetical protein